MNLTNIKIRGTESRDKVWVVAWHCLAKVTGKYDNQTWEQFEEKIIAPVNMDWTVYNKIRLYISRNNYGVV